ncbi:SDR family NAD(P)-dependent oxidoreductase [Streptomyces jumonjinensis]|uniref:SDR family NAD(P)-dependent oxidoreductase n=1 Tax=Streptomyces jumonjinensis TaxID=1945 RepID=UPI003793EC8F
MRRTVAVFGAGSGMGASVAHRFGREGHRVALVARRRDPLDKLVARLAADGVEAAAFPADLRHTERIPALVSAIEARFEHIDVAVYAPFVPATLIPAADVDAAVLRAWLDLYLLSPVELAHTLLPGMLERGDGALLFGYGSSVVTPAADLSGPVPVLAALRNYLHTLHGEVADRGVHVGGLAVRAVIERSEGHRALRSGDMRLAIDLPTVDPDELADLAWNLVTHRDRTEVVHPAP